MAITHYFIASSHLPYRGCGATGHAAGKTSIWVHLQIEERKRLHAKLMQKVRERQMKPAEAADEMKAEVSSLYMLPVNAHVKHFHPASGSSYPARPHETLGLLLLRQSKL